ncbi:MAG TPA: hypothetical protein VLK85_18530 [Ramlibacter sp.]|nr:hypothetical protein [Ramlibacter sp.]
MDDETLLLYYTMTERFSDHLSARGAYPEKFVLNPLLHNEYLRCMTLLSQSVGKAIDPTSHMGVPIEVDENSPGVMVAADGSEVSLNHPAMPTLKLTNHSALAARILGFLFFGVPGMLGFFYGTYLWLQDSPDLTSLDALKDLGGPLLGLGIALVFGWLAFTTDRSVELDAQGLRVRTLAGVRSYGWTELRGVSLHGLTTKLGVVGRIGPTVAKTTQVAFEFNAAGGPAAHQVVIRRSEIDSLVHCLRAAGRDDLLG